MQTKNDRAAWLKGGMIVCSFVSEPKAHPYRFILLGAPGVGKGTQAVLLSEYFGACHLSTGDVFRAAKTLSENERSAAMTIAFSCMQRGELVSDETVLNMVGERSKCLRCSGGFLLDGFPRTVPQAKALEKLLAEQSVKLDGVLDYRLPLKTIIARLSGRRTCTKCKAVFHVESLPPKIEGICDHCGGTLFQREDDRPESIRVRMAAYAKNTVPLKRFYQRRKLLFPITAAGTPDATFERTLAALNLNQPAETEPIVRPL